MKTWAPKCPLPNYDPVNTKKLKLAIVGLGHLHPRHYMPHFQAVPNIEVVAVAEADACLREQFCRDFGVHGYLSVDELLAGETLDIAAIFLPHAKGIHLMVEKPMAASAVGAQRILDAAREAGVKLSTGYVWRLHPVAREFKRLIDEGLVGSIVGGEGRCAAGRLTRYIEGNSAWMLQSERSGGGPMYNLGVHWIDLFRWILGEEVTEVSGRNVKVNALYDIEDNSFAHLRFAGGAIVALDISYTVPAAFPNGRELYLSVRGTQGVITWAPAYEGQSDKLFVCSDHPSFAGSPKVLREYELQPTPGYSGYMGLEYVRAFVDAIRSDSEPPITGEDGCAALRVVEAVYRADAEKRWADVEGKKL